jgi:hypothetical protein
MEVDLSVTHQGIVFAGYNKPKRTPGAAKKFAVLAKEGDRAKLVRFGQPGYSSNYSPEARKAYRTRHAKEATQSKLTPGWWSYHYGWKKGGPVSRAGQKSKHGERFK